MRLPSTAISLTTAVLVGRVDGPSRRDGPAQRAQQWARFAGDPKWQATPRSQPTRKPCALLNLLFECCLKAPQKPLTAPDYQRAPRETNKRPMVESPSLVQRSTHPTQAGS